MARGAAARGKRIAFGDGHKIYWDQHSAHIFQGNPNIARPGTERQRGIRWIDFRKGNRGYNRQDGDRWIWNYDWKAIPGQIFFTDTERNWASKFGKKFVVIEPNLPLWKAMAANKDWGREKYQAVATSLLDQGIQVIQFDYHKTPRLDGVLYVRTGTFRNALAILKNASLYIGPEGGLHHGAAAVETKAVVLFGGFIPPSVTGYDTHINLTGGAEACGMLRPCDHCRAAMAAISVDEVLSAVERLL